MSTFADHRPSVNSDLDFDARLSAAKALRDEARRYLGITAVPDDCDVPAEADDALDVLAADIDWWSSRPSAGWWLDDIDAAELAELAEMDRVLRDADPNDLGGWDEAPELDYEPHCFACDGLGWEFDRHGHRGRPCGRCNAPVYEPRRSNPVTDFDLPHYRPAR